MCRAENPDAKITKTAISEGDTLEYFDFVVDTFGETIGVGTVESVEDVRFPVFQHREAGSKLREIGDKRMSTKDSEAFFCL